MWSNWSPKVKPVIAGKAAPGSHCRLLLTRVLCQREKNPIDVIELSRHRRRIPNQQHDLQQHDPDDPPGTVKSERTSPSISSHRRTRTRVSNDRGDAVAVAESGAIRFILPRSPAAACCSFALRCAPYRRSDTKPASPAGPSLPPFLRPGVWRCSQPRYRGRSSLLSR